MKTTLLKQLFFTAFVIFGFSFVSAQATYTFSTGQEGWALAYGQPGSNSGTVTHDATGGESGDGALVLDRESNNSNIGLNPAGIDASIINYIRVKFKNLTLATSLRVQGSSSEGDLTPKVFPISPNTDQWVTLLLDVSDITNWGGTVDNLDILVRGNFPASPTTEGNIFFDEIEFFSYQDDFSEFIKNPSFDDLSGITHLSGNQPFGSRTLTTDEFHNGTQSLKLEFTADADATWWTFSNYEKDYSPTLYATGSELEIKMWVKTNRTEPINISSRVKLVEGDDATQPKPIQSVKTLNTSMEWEELTFTLVSQAPFNKVTYWFALVWADETGGAVDENLNFGDIVYIDELSATITNGTLGVDKNVLDNVKIYPNPTSDILNVSCPEGTDIEVYNVLGVKVRSEQDVKESHTMNVSNLSSGLYFMKMESEGKVTTKKFQVK